MSGSGGVVTLGETMALLASTTVGPLQHTRTMTLGIGGSEPAGRSPRWAAETTGARP